MNQRLYALHGWLGLNFGLVLFIVCLSGTIAVVSHEIDWLITPAMRVSPQDERASLDAMYQAVQQAHPEAPIRSLLVPAGGRNAYEFWIAAKQGGTVRVFVDPHTGVVQGTTAWFNTQRFFRDFHRRFFWYSWWGIWLVAAYGFFLLGSAATGLAFYKRWWAKLFVLRFAKGRRVFWSDLHRLTGVWTFLFSIVIAVTGIWYLFEIPLGWYDLPETARQPQRIEKPEGKPVADAEWLPVDEWVRIAGERLPGFEVRTIRIPRRPDAPAYLDGQTGALLVRDRANKILIDPCTGAVQFEQAAGDLAPLARWADTADPLHFGNFGGLTSKLIWVLFGLALSALMPTGAYLWVRRAAIQAAGAERRLQAAGTDADEARREIRRVIQRRTNAGIISTTIIGLLTGYATFSAVRDQFPETEGGDLWWSLGGAGAVAVYGGFLLLSIAATLFWYRCIWFLRPSSSFAEQKMTAC